MHAYAKQERIQFFLSSILQRGSICLFLFLLCKPTVFPRGSGPLYPSGSDHAKQDQTNGRVSVRIALQENAQLIIRYLYYLQVLSRCICSRVSLVSLLLYIAAPPTFYQIFMNNGLLQKTKVEFPY